MFCALLSSELRFSALVSCGLQSSELRFSALVSCGPQFFGVWFCALVFYALRSSEPWFGGLLFCALRSCAVLPYGLRSSELRSCASLSCGLQSSELRFRAVFPADDFSAWSRLLYVDRGAAPIPEICSNFWTPVSRASRATRSAALTCTDWNVSLPRSTYRLTAFTTANPPSMAAVTDYPH